MWHVCFLGKSFRHEQCEAKNGYQSDAKGVKTFVEWVPKYAGVLPGDVCKLTCRAKGTGYYVVFSPKVSNCPDIIGIIGGNHLVEGSSQMPTVNSHYFFFLGGVSRFRRTLFSSL